MAAVPAGALAGTLLASGGREVVLCDEKLAWEKPCGGGVTYKALQQYPVLAEARRSHPVEDCELIRPSGPRVRFHLQHPVAIFSRLALNGLLLDCARHAGDRDGDAWQLTSPQRKWKSSYIILAAGVRNSFRAQFLSPISPDELMVTAGYFIPGRSSLMQIQFLRDITGYIWIFPRSDHASAGIACTMGEISTAELRRILEQWLDRNGFRRDGATFYSHILPSFRSQTFDTLDVSGNGWAMIGDSAGLVDPITGEGLYYSLKSAELCATALLANQPASYRQLLEEEVLPELRLAARVSQRFYRGQIFGDSVHERMISLTSQSASMLEVMGYRDLRARLYKILPAVMAEGVAGSFRWPWNNSSGPGLAIDPLAE